MTTEEYHNKLRHKAKTKHLRPPQNLDKYKDLPATIKPSFTPQYAWT